MRGYCGIGIIGNKFPQNIGTLWRSAHLFGASFIFTIGNRYKNHKTDTSKAYLSIPLFDYHDFNTFENSIPKDSRLICIEKTETSHSLSNFIHPEQGIYLLGAEDYGIPKEITNIYPTVYIPTLYDFSLNVSVAGSIILSDRYIKMNKNNKISV